MTLGEKLHRLRKTKGISQEQLASQINVSRQAVSKWELGESSPDIDNIIQLSKLFDVTTDYLLKDDINSSYDEKPEVKNETLLPVLKSKTKIPAKMLSGGILSVLGICGVLLFWILSILNPVVYYNGSSMNKDTYTGLQGYLLTNNAVGLFVFCCVTGIVGIFIVAFEINKKRISK